MGFAGPCVCSNIFLSLCSPIANTYYMSYVAFAFIDSRMLLAHGVHTLHLFIILINISIYNFLYNYSVSVLNCV
jgi:hypothetical protein